MKQQYPSKILFERHLHSTSKKWSSCTANSTFIINRKVIDKYAVESFLSVDRQRRDNPIISILYIDIATNECMLQLTLVCRRRITIMTFSQVCLCVYYNWKWKKYIKSSECR